MSVQGTNNRLLTDDIIVKEALRLLKNNLVMAPLVYRELEPKFANVGDVISLQKPFRTKTASGRQLVKQPMVDQKIPFEINHREHFGLEITQYDRTLSLENFSERYLKSGMVQIANVIDRSLLLRMRNAYFTSGTPGSAPTVLEFMQADAHQTNVGVPDDGMRRAVLPPLDCASISDEISEKQQQKMVKQAIQKGYMGPLSNYDVFKSANIPTHTVGNYGGTPKIKGANQTGEELITDGWDTSVTGLLKQGDVFTINGVFEINPQSYESTGRLQRFVCQEDVDSDGSGEATIKVYPSINDGTLTTTDSEGNTLSLAAYQNVSDSPADNATISVDGTAGTTYRQGFLFHKEALALCMVDLQLPSSANMKSRVRDPESGLSLSMTGDYDIYEDSEITRIDAVWGEDLIYPELAHRLWSA